MLNSKKFPELKPKLINVGYGDVESIKLLGSLITGHNVLIHSRSRLETISKYHSSVAFHISQDGYDNVLGNIAIRKTLDPVRLKMLIKL